MPSSELDLVQGIYYQPIETNVWFQMNKILAEIWLLDKLDVDQFKFDNFDFD